MEKAKQPTIAIIVGQYYEKTAVDTMMTNRQTFVRYATVGQCMEGEQVIVIVLFCSVFTCFDLCSLILFCFLV